MDWFEISNELADKLNLSTLISAALKSQRAHESKQKRNACRLNARRQFIEDYVAQHSGFPPPIREMGQILKSVGFAGSIGTVQQDYRLLGFHLKVGRRPNFLS